MSRPKVMIEIHGGAITRITSTQDTQFVVVQYGASAKRGDRPSISQKRQDEMLPEDLLDNKIYEVKLASVQVPF